jgi:hypothetical protein
MGAIGVEVNMLGEKTPQEYYNELWKATDDLEISKGAQNTIQLKAEAQKKIQLNKMILRSLSKMGAKKQ